MIIFPCSSTSEKTSCFTEHILSWDMTPSWPTDTLSALDDISTYRVNVLPQIAQTIADFRQNADEG